MGIASLGIDVGGWGWQRPRLEGKCTSGNASARTVLGGLCSGIASPRQKRCNSPVDVPSPQQLHRGLLSSSFLFAPIT